MGVPGAAAANASAATLGGNATSLAGNASMPIAQDTIAELRKEQMKTDLSGLVLVVKNPGISQLGVGQEVDGNLNPLSSNDTLKTLGGLGAANATNAAVANSSLATAAATG